MSSMLETLRPITHISATLPPPLSKFHSIRLQSSRVLHHRFTPDINSNRLSFPSINPKSFNFLSSTKIRDYKILAECQESDSTGKTNSETESPNNPSSAPSSSTNSGSRQKREKRGKSEWWFSKERKWKWQPLIPAQEIGVLLLQLGILMFVMRLLGPGIPLPGSEPTQPTTFVGVPYSEFLSKISSNQLQKVEVDGVHIRFKLKNEGISSQNSGDGGEVVNSKFQDSGTLLRSVTPTTKRIVYTTTRPTDIKTPYEKMLENQVEFGSPDKRSGGFLNSALVSVDWKLIRGNWCEYTVL